VLLSQPHKELQRLLVTHDGGDLPVPAILEKYRKTLWNGAAE
jgi:hypothetical protein